MKKALISCAILAVCAAAHATDPKTTTVPAVTGYQLQGQLQAQRQAQTQTAAGGAGFGSSTVTGITGIQGGTFGGNSTLGSGNDFGGSLNLAGASIGATEQVKQTPPSYAPAGSAPLKSCRLFVGLGAAGTGASGSAGIPIGNDAFCVVDNALALMEKFPRQFSEQDKLGLVCKLEGMAETEGCKKAADRRGTGSRTGVASLELLP